MPPPEAGGVVDHEIHERVNYPKHAPRKATKLYEKSHKKLVHTLDLPCRICRVRNSTLADPAHNRHGSKNIQTHHILEDSLANAIDVQKFNALYLPHLAREHPRKTLYQTAFTQEQMISWIHGHEDNLLVLCEKCHVGKYTGVHYLTWPIWLAQELIYDNYDLTGARVENADEATQLVNLPTTTGIPVVLDKSKA